MFLQKEKAGIRVNRSLLVLCLSFGVCGEIGLFPDSACSTVVEAERQLGDRICSSAMLPARISMTHDPLVIQQLQPIDHVARQRRPAPLIHHLPPNCLCWTRVLLFCSLQDGKQRFLVLMALKTVANCTTPCERCDNSRAQGSCTYMLR